jgi:hypothetical protein
LFRRYDFNTLYAPRTKITTNSREGEDNLATGGYPLTNGKDLYLFLIPADSYQINSVLPKPESGKMAVTWFYPFTGEFKEEGVMPWSGWKSFQSPWKGSYSVVIVKMQ